VTIPQVLQANGYRTYMSGKWHVSSNLKTPTDSWPMQRGFDKFFGTIIGAGSFYDPNTLTRGNENVEHEARRPGWFYTDAISDQAVAYIDEHCRDTNGTPFFAYVAYTAPHWPLHAHDDGHRALPRPLRRRLGRAARNAPRKARRLRHPEGPLEAHRPRPDTAAVARS
jgi:arylsulfatase